MKRTYKTIAVLSLTASLATIPITAYASQWQQDSTGWRIQSDDGTYLTNQWYQNTDGKWYYIGADSYMLCNTYTPDGYFVGLDGAWIQQSNSVQNTQPQVQPTQDDSIMTEEEFDRISREAGITGNGEGKVDIITGEEELGGDIDSADFNWHQ